MRRDHWFGRGVYDVPERLVRKMRNINHHSEPIHLANHLFAKISETARLSDLISRRSGPAGAYGPCPRHVTDAHLVIALDVFNSFVDGIAAFQTHQRGHPATGGNAPNVAGG